MYQLPGIAKFMFYDNKIHASSEAKVFCPRIASDYQQTEEEH